MLIFLPIIVTFIIYQVRFNYSGGDLSRLGKISVPEDYRDKLLSEYDGINTYYFEWTENLEEYEFDVLVLGDSFSQQNELGYQNFLAMNSSVKVLNISNSYFDTSNSLINLYELINSDFFDDYHFDYILIQSVERAINLRTIEFTEYAGSTQILDDKNDYQDIVSYSSSELLKDPLDLVMKELNDATMYSLYNLAYTFDNNAYISPVYKFKLKDSNFSYNENLLVYEDDVNNLKYKNDNGLTSQTNQALNFLQEYLDSLDIDLIFLPAPDKLTIYQEDIATFKYDNSYFYEDLSLLEKKYIYIDSYKLLYEAIKNNVLDVYYYDDTHWSPIGAKIIADKLIQIIEN